MKRDSSPGQGRSGGEEGGGRLAGVRPDKGFRTDGRGMVGATWLMFSLYELAFNGQFELQPLFKSPFARILLV